jgi:hypothetical protein
VDGPDVDAIDRDPDGVGTAAARLTAGHDRTDEERPMAGRSTRTPAS